MLNHTINLDFGNKIYGMINMEAIPKFDIKSVIKSDIKFDIRIKPTTWIGLNVHTWLHYFGKLKTLNFTCNNFNSYTQGHILVLTNSRTFFFSVSYSEYIAKTDLAISQLNPWRSKIKSKSFSSRVRFQIRIDDLRGLVVNGEANIDQILGFYNQATDALLNLYSKESRAIKGSATWKSIIVYKNMLWAIDNIGVNAAWVIKYYTKGTLSNDEIVQYLR